MKVRGRWQKRPTACATPRLFFPETRSEWTLLLTLNPRSVAAATSASPRGGVTNTTLPCAPQGILSG